MAASKQAHKVYEYAKGFLSAEVMVKFNLTPEGYDKALDACVGPHIDRDMAADIMIKMFKIQWENLKE